MKSFESEISSGDRFKFGENWSRFLSSLNEDRIERSMRGLREWLGLESLRSMTFLDVGSGSGLSSLAAYRLGATVKSFDYDPQSVECTRKLCGAYASEPSRWSLEQGSVLDKDFLSTLGTHDIVYSWGVIHHTGNMWQGLENLVPMVASRGYLFIAIYNDQGPWSRRWKFIKKVYNKLPAALASAFAVIVMGGRELRYLLGALVKLRPFAYVRSWTNYGGVSSRGMSKYHDLVDWIGGYPFEVAKPEEIFEFYRKRGFVLEKMSTNRAGVACNQFVFRRVD